MTDQEKEIKELKEEIEDLEYKVKNLEDELEDANEEIEKLVIGEHPYYDKDKETLEDSRKDELLEDNWEYFTAQQLEGFLKMIGRSI